MVGHESVDPKPQEKSDQGTGVIRTFDSFRIREKRHPLVKAKGNPVLIPEPGCGYVRRQTTSTLVIYGRGNAKQTGEAAENPGKSFLFCLRDRDPGIPSRGERVTDLAVKGYPEERRVSAASVVVFGWPLKIRWEGYVVGRSRLLVPISASGLLGEQPLVDR